MFDNVCTLGRADIKATDTNSLLRFHDIVAAVLQTSLRRNDRERATAAVQRIEKELQKRRVSL